MSTKRNYKFKKEIRNMWERSTSQVPFDFRKQVDNMAIQRWCIEKLRVKKSTHATKRE